MVANVLPADPQSLPTLGMGSTCQNPIFSEHSHIAYQIKGKHNFSMMVANILSTDPQPPPPPLFSLFFQNIVMYYCCIYQIKGNHKCSNMVAEPQSPHPTPPPPQLECFLRCLSVSGLYEVEGMEHAQQMAKVFDKDLMSMVTKKSCTRRLFVKIMGSSAIADYHN